MLQRVITLTQHRMRSQSASCLLYTSIRKVNSTDNIVVYVVYEDTEVVFVGYTELGVFGLAQKTAVSYTHLDVYKRQRKCHMCHIQISIIGKPFLTVTIP